MQTDKSMVFTPFFYIFYLWSSSHTQILAISELNKTYGPHFLMDDLQMQPRDT